MSDVAGTYTLTTESVAFLQDKKKFPSVPTSTVTLEPDGQFEISQLPDCYVDLRGSCKGKFVGASGKWTVEQTGSDYGVSLYVTKTDARVPLPFWIASSSVIVKRPTAPFQLRFFIGDPGSHEFISYDQGKG